MATIRLTIKLFVGMQEDDLLQQIEADIINMSEEMTLIDRIDQTVENYEPDILVKFRHAKKMLDACGLI